MAKATTTTFNSVMRVGAGGTKSGMIKGTPILSYETPSLTAADLPFEIYFPGKIFISAITVVTSGAGALPAAGDTTSNFYSDDGQTLDKAFATVVVTTAGIQAATGDAVYVDEGKSLLRVEEGTAITADAPFHLRYNYYQLDPKDGAA